ncbi:hypothetical protein [Leptospira alstonii]|uniref:Uncharacterized protein n=2 Tax=Leptospira alstonii TaxID=28452 RepID=M6D4J8_9LEPT|nr:hypothetical protein [Leptospira alstonii]EMJ97611.1 hypothetical protein LEP1GSC194_2993 [Leptospira alstonii serovar Sichuan str. 79601]EQA79407.1 hypothetical protein LEP1GSC193_3213 [Leptospira alstonii serovar Pingchang str. 80-412]
MNVEYAILVKNKTRLEGLIERFNTKQQARFYIERLGGRFEEYEIEHEIFHESLDLIQKRISKKIKYKIVERIYVPSFLFSKKNVIVTIESLMPSGGVIFSDGIETDYLKFNSGSIVTIGVSSENATLVVK